MVGRLNDFPAAMFLMEKPPKVFINIFMKEPILNKMETRAVNDVRTIVYEDPSTSTRKIVNAFNINNGIV